MSGTDDREVLLRVENLCRYYRLGRGENRAVDNVSFDIRKGEIFGLVGESGCGKTTVARSIVRYQGITSGSIFFKGRRICAGTHSYEEEIRALRRELASLQKDAPDREIRRAELEERIAHARGEIGKARRDDRAADRLPDSSAEERVRQEYEPELERLRDDPDAYEALKQEYGEALRAAKKTRLVTRIQMIFQDPAASLDPRMTAVRASPRAL